MPTIQVYFTPHDGIAGHTEYIDTVTKPPYTAASTPPGLSPQEYQDFLDKEAEKRCQSYALVLKDPNASMSRAELRPLPDVQPECPKQWDASAWNKRHVFGNARYHIFIQSADYSGGLKPSFVLRVSDEPRDGKLVYEDIGSMSPDLESEVWKFQVEMVKLMHQGEGIDLPADRKKVLEDLVDLLSKIPEARETVSILSEFLNAFS